MLPGRLRLGKATDAQGTSRGSCPSATSNRSMRASIVCRAATIFVILCPAGSWKLQASKMRMTLAAITAATSGVVPTAASLRRS